MNDNEQIEEKINNLTTEIDQITNDLTTLHLQEAVLKHKLNKKIANKIQLTVQQRETNHRSTNRVNQVQIPVPAIIVPETISVPETRKDRDGAVIDIGDEVYFLTKGQNTSNIGIVNRVTRTYIHCTDLHRINTKRAAKNLRIKEKFHEC